MAPLTRWTLTPNNSGINFQNSQRDRYSLEHQPHLGSPHYRVRSPIACSRPSLRRQASSSVTARKPEEWTFLARGFENDRL